MDNLPKSGDILKTLLGTLRDGKTLTNGEIRYKVQELLQISQEEASKVRTGNRTELEYRLAWARTQAKGKGLIVSGARESWKMTEKGLEAFRETK